MNGFDDMNRITGYVERKVVVNSVRRYKRCW
jgi:hypothetical protein